MNRKIPIAIFQQRMVEQPEEDILTLHSLGFQLLDWRFNHLFQVPIAFDKGQELVVRINKEGATIEICKIEP